MTRIPNPARGGAFTVDARSGELRADKASAPAPVAVTPPAATPAPPKPRPRRVSKTTSPR